MYQYQKITPYWAALMPPIDSITPIGIPGLPQPQPQQQIVNDNDNINIGSGNQIIGNGNPSPVTVTQVTTDTYTALATDYMLCVETLAAPPTPVSITLPVSPLGTVYIVKDCSGNAAISTITITGTSSLIDGAASATINAPFGALQFIFTGTEWSIV